MAHRAVCRGRVVGLGKRALMPAFVDIEQITWLPVTDAMPDDDTTVLVYAPKSDEPVWLGYFDGADWVTVDGTPYDEDDGSVPIAWAPLPQGPARE